MTIANVYSTSGSIVANLVNENEVAGQHTVKFRAEGLKGGVYFYQVENARLFLEINMGATAIGTGIN